MDDLVKRLRETQALYEKAGIDGAEGVLQAREAADRIEALEAQLAAADELAEALMDIRDKPQGLPSPIFHALAAYRKARGQTERESR
jgi:hypothetical protein